MKIWLGLVWLWMGAVVAQPLDIYLIRARDVGSTDLARMILYVRVPDTVPDAQLTARIAQYAAEQAKVRRVDELTVWVDLAAATNCEKLAGKPYLSYRYPARTSQLGFASRKEYLATVASLRAKGSCKPLY